MWLEADKFQFILKRSITKSDAKYEADVKRAIKRSGSSANINRYISEETFHKTIEGALESALEFSMRDCIILQEVHATPDCGTMKKPVGAKNIEALKVVIAEAKADIVKSFKGTLKEFKKESLQMLQENARLKEQVKKLNVIIKNQRT